MPKKSSSSGSRAIATVMVLAALGVGGFAMYVQNTPSARRVPDEIRRPKPEAQPSGPRTEIHAQPAPENPKAGLKVVQFHDGQLQLVDATSEPSGQDPIAFVATETLHNLGVSQARAVGVDVQSGNAILDMNPEFLSQGFGSMEEGQVIEALSLALGQFPTVQTYQLRIDGEIVDSIGGHIELTEPIPVKTSGATDAATSPTTPAATP